LNFLFDTSNVNDSNFDEESKLEKDPKEIQKQTQSITEPKENVMVVPTPKQKLNESSFF
jgi:hypothetical protein